jgi:hypothetical protein
MLRRLARTPVVASSRRWYQAFSGIGSPTQTMTGLRPHDAVKVEWKGVHWEASVKDIKPDENMILVSFPNWSTEWDEWIDFTSPRLIHPKNITGLAPSPPSTSSTEVEIAGVKYVTSRLRTGQSVFLDPATGLMSLCPALLVRNLPPSVTESPSSSSLPEGWIERSEPNGSRYYFNLVNQTAQWTVPRLPASRVAENMSLAVSFPSKTTPWETHFDLDGYPYYHNSETGETTWNPPAETMKGTESSSAGPSESSSAEMPPGWEVYYTEEGVPYYYCMTTQESHWELPTMYLDESVVSNTNEIFTSAQEEVKPVKKPAKKKSAKKSPARRSGGEK